MKIYKPISNDSVLFENKDENIVNELEFKGAKSTDAKKLEISNQGGVLIFRCANNNIGTYTSNDDAEINHDELLKKLNINNDDLKEKISFDVIFRMQIHRLSHILYIHFITYTAMLLFSGITEAAA